MSGKKVILLMQGGGALGAFQCGVWEALYPYFLNNGDIKAESDRYLVVMVNLHQPITDNKPESAMECSYRLLNIIFGTKPDSDISASHSINSHIDFLQKAKEVTQHLPDV